MKIDLRTDFDALLYLAQVKHEEYEKVIDECRPLYKIDVENGMLIGYPPNVQAKIDEAREQWAQWVKVNIYDRGLELCNDMLGRPIAISAILAGKKN